MLDDLGDTDEYEHRLAIDPVPLLPELYADLDLQLLAAANEVEQWQVLIAGTRDVIDRFDYLAQPQVSCLNASDVIAALRKLVADQLSTPFCDFHDRHAPAFAAWLQSEVIDLLCAHQQLHLDCVEQVRHALNGGDHDTAVAAIIDAAASLRVAAEQVAARLFAPYPLYPATPVNNDNLRLAIAAGGSLGAEVHREPLRNQLDGAGGAAGSPEFNPWVAAMFDLELVTHRRLYRLLYGFCEHVGITLQDEHHLFMHPDHVDQQPL